MKTATVRSRKKHVYKKRLALLLPGKDEQLIIAATIRSAIAAGQKREDIFVVDDGSTDKTRKEALKELPRKNVLSIANGGKAKAVISGIEHFEVEKRYTWLHVADADSVFGPNYFRIYRKNLNAKKYAVALGFVQSLRGNWISTYRALTYTYSQHIFRRFQSYFGMISVFPGPITCFKTSILKDLDFTAYSLTEDLDLTIQVHRKKLGKIKFIPEAVNYTQDPQTLRDFIKQNQRWQRGFFQAFTKYRIGTKPQPLDIGLVYQMIELVFYLVQMFVLIPYVLIQTGNWGLIPLVAVADSFVLIVLALFSALAAKRLSILLCLPYFSLLRALEVAVFIQAFIEVVVLRKFRKKVHGWDVAGRRYALNEKALKDVAQ